MIKSFQKYHEPRIDEYLPTHIEFFISLRRCADDELRVGRFYSLCEACSRGMELHTVCRTGHRDAGDVRTREFDGKSLSS